MKLLSNKIPPPIILIVCAIIIWVLRDIGPRLDFNKNIKFGILLLCVITSIAIDLSALYEFRKHKTTINPLSPNKASQIVQSGVYKYSRNPMYVGMVLLLFGFSFTFGGFFSFVIIPIFIFYINYFQIIPEEQALLNKFGDIYTSYKSKVRRWI